MHDDFHDLLSYRMSSNVSCQYIHKLLLVGTGSHVMQQIELAPPDAMQLMPQQLDGDMKSFLLLI